MTDIYPPIILSIQCAFLAALINLPWGLFWGWILSRKRFKGKLFLQTILYSPLVLPPVLTGYFLFVIFSKDSILGGCFNRFLHLAFVLDWKGVVLASAVVASPFMIQLIKEALDKIDVRLEFVARNLGAGPFKVFHTITLPLIWSGIMSGFFLCFARALGEFGATIMLAGNIPGKTQTLPLAIYTKVSLGLEEQLWPLVAATILLAYAGLGLSYWATRFSRIS